MEIDANGIITSGRYQGHKLDDLETYLGQLEDTVAKPATPPAAPPKAPANPNTVLNEHGAARVAPLENAVLQRFEQDDEASFSATVQDYDKFKDKIAEMKKALLPQAKMAKGLHAMLYGMIKQQEDPAARAAIYGGPKPPDPEVPPSPPQEEPPAAPPETPKNPSTEDLLSQVKKPSAKAASPVAAPTAPGRDSQDNARKPKLKATPKIIKMAEALGKPVDEYLLILEDQGTTQATLETASIKRVERKANTFDRWGG